MKKTTIFMAAVLAVAAVFAAGLTVLPSTVQNAQADEEVNEFCEDNFQDTPGDAIVICKNINVVSRGDN